MSICSMPTVPTARLIRAPADNVANSAAHEYFSGSATDPAWSTKAADASSVFDRPGRRVVSCRDLHSGAEALYPCGGPLENGTPSANKLGIFEAPDPWGPWRTVYYADNFLGLRGGSHLGMHFPIKWQSADGRTLWATFSCHNNLAPGSCGQYHDRFNMMKVTLTVQETTGDPADGVGEDDGTDCGGGVDEGDGTVIRGGRRERMAELPVIRMRAS